MTLDWSSSSIEHARDAQERHDWSDEELLARLETVLRVGHVPDIARERAGLLAAYDALPPTTPVTTRIEHLARVLPALSGPWASVSLADLLTRARDVPAPPADPTSRPHQHDARRDWRRGLLVVLATWAALVVLAVLVVWLR